ncbi:hypothetical protein [Pedobacter sp. ASV28]|uniref:hypothetical protein n=1 Tax=Pedobacter sp. ASV28 TaxID=2795123 RepID=UPI0018EBFE83|nr:hypothetical protein [Pedobacter sp. ASV28]
MYTIGNDSQLFVPPNGNRDPLQLGLGCHVPAVYNASDDGRGRINNEPKIGWRERQHIAYIKNN